MMYAMARMGTVAAGGNCLLTNTQNSSSQYIGNETMQVRRGLWQLNAP